jgi:hypothetical protein
MRILFTLYPSHAHLWPVVPLAWAFQSAGHEVRVATHGGFVDSIAAAGLTPVLLGERTDGDARMRPDARPPAPEAEVLRYAEVMGLEGAAREHWIAFYQMLLNPASDYARTDLPAVEQVVDFARAWRPDLVLWDPTFASGAVAARVSGAAHARLVPGMDYFGFSLDRLAEHRDAVVAAGLAENPLADVVRPLAEKYGLDVDDDLLLGQWTVDPLPTGLSLPTSRHHVPFRWVPFTGIEPAPDWLREPPRRPRVALSLGESTRRFISGDWGRSPKIFEAVADLDVEVVATLNALQLHEIDRVPDNVRVQEWVPLTQLLPTCATLIHHGGMGTFSAASAFGVPQIVCDSEESVLMRQVEVEVETGRDDGTYRVGWEFGKRENVVEKVTTWELPAKKLEATPCADYVIGRGAGARLNHLTSSVAEIAKQIQAVATEPAYAEGAAALRESWLVTPAPADIVPVLIALADGHRAR